MATIIIAPLSTPASITLEAINTCKEARCLFVQTEASPAVLPLKEAGLSYGTMDDLYDAAEDFDALNTAIAERLLEAAKAQDVVYAVPGRGISPELAQLLQEKAALIQLPGSGYAQAALCALGMAQAMGVSVYPASSLPKSLDAYRPYVVEEIDTPITAGEVKLALAEFWPDEWPIHVGMMDETGRYQMKTIPLYELDRQPRYRADFVACVPEAAFSDLDRYDYRGLMQVMQRLRAPDGCPWDREQTHQTLKKDLLEECYEVFDAIDRQDDEALCEELGDVLLQVAFHAQLAEEQSRFTNRDIATGIVNKLVYRHPHVFSDGRADTSDAVLVKWEQLKKKEKHFETQTDVLNAVPKGFPALVRSYKVQKKAAQVGFDWDSAEEAFPKLVEETEELRSAMQNGGNIAEEMGDLLFAAVNVARLLKLDPEFLLAAATDKFTSRFAAMEGLALARGMKLEDMTLKDMDVLWDEVKKAQK